MSNSRPSLPSPQGMGPLLATHGGRATRLDPPQPTASAPREQGRASSDGASRPPTDITAPRRAPAGWLRSPAEAPAPEPRASPPSSIHATGVSGADPTALAYQVLEQFIEEGRGSMQRWMRSVAATPPLDVPRLGGATNLEALGRMANDALSLLAGPATRPTRAPAARVPIRAPGPTSAPAPSPSPKQLILTSPSAEATRPRDTESRASHASALASTALAPAEPRNVEQRSRGSSEDRPVTMAPRAELRTNGTVVAEPMRPATQSFKMQPLVALDPSWGEIVKLR